ncbi:MAG: class I SAM-dependent methyltransferase [Methanomicrobiales archaeon]|nr:class I SAM-dependent methyltransferase [Methanomicrobiales archaeon]
MSFFDSAYKGGPPPWDIGRPQKEFVELVRRGEIIGSVLDIGCGTGEHALFFAAEGHEVWAIDSAPLAIEKAKEKAAERGLRVHFLVMDALHMSELIRKFDTGRGAAGQVPDQKKTAKEFSTGRETVEQVSDQERTAKQFSTGRESTGQVPDQEKTAKQFSTATDSGLFHTLSDEDRPAFVDALAAVLSPGGKYFMLCFSDLEPAGYGPRRITQGEIRESFRVGWTINYIRPATFESRTRAEGPRAWLSSISRK